MNLLRNKLCLKGCFLLCLVQLQPGFNVQEFSQKMSLLRFSFVRHPFERYPVQSYKTTNQEISCTYHLWFKDHICLWGQNYKLSCCYIERSNVDKLMPLNGGEKQGHVLAFLCWHNPGTCWWGRMFAIANIRVPDWWSYKVKSFPNEQSKIFE